jgi:Sec-independent protein translocase protein TatA
VFDDKLFKQPICLCGLPFGSAGPSKDSDPAIEVRGAFAKFMEALDPAIKNRIQKECPELAEPKMEPDHYREVARANAEAYRNFKNLAEQKKQLQDKEKALRDQLAKVQTNLAKTTDELDEAEQLYNTTAKTYAEVVKGVPPNPQAAAEAGEAGAPPPSEKPMDVEEEFDVDAVEQSEDYKQFVATLEPDKRSMVEGHQKAVASAAKRRKVVAKGTAESNPTTDQAEQLVQAAKAIGQLLASMGTAGGSSSYSSGHGEGKKG